jgi:hypothetical protein
LNKKKAPWQDLLHPMKIYVKNQMVYFGWPNLMVSQSPKTPQPLTAGGRGEDK